MEKQSGPDSDAARPAQKEGIEPQKRPYRTPRLVTYGKLRELSLVKGGMKSDGGGSPPSRV